MILASIRVRGGNMKKLNLGQFITIAITALMSFNLGNSDRNDFSSLERLNLKDLRPVIVSAKGGRAPASYAPSDDLAPAPLNKESFSSQIWAEDNSGILKSMQRDFKRWEMLDEYAKNRNLQSTGLYDTPNADVRTRYLKKRMVKYLDRRLAGEMKSAKKGSALNRVKQIQKTLRPAAEAQVSKRIKVKFKARLLEGRAVARIENPWVKTEVSNKIGGSTEVKAIRSIASLQVNASLNYQVNKKQWEMAINRPLSKAMMAKISSTQSSKDMAFGGSSDRKAEVIFFKRF